MPKTKVGLFVGRFQPFHNGHLAAVRYALKRVDYLYIVVGSAQRSHERYNPFTAGERIMMIKAALNEAHVPSNRWMLIPVHDAESHSVWTATLKSTVPKFDIVFSNDTLTIRLLKEEGIRVVPVPYLNRSDDLCHERQEQDPGEEGLGDTGASRHRADRHGPRRHRTGEKHDKQGFGGPVGWTTPREN